MSQKPKTAITVIGSDIGKSGTTGPISSASNISRPPTTVRRRSVRRRHPAIRTARLTPRIAALPRIYGDLRFLPQHARLEPAFGHERLCDRSANQHRIHCRWGFQHRQYHPRIG
jgi:hypothetical protein